MTRSKWDSLWVPTFALLVAFAVPWFLWGVDIVLAGLPVWLWWHIGWMGLCTALFYRFSQGAWERGMTFDADLARGTDTAESARAAAGRGTNIDTGDGGGESDRRDGNGGGGGERR